MKLGGVKKTGQKTAKSDSSDANKKLVILLTIMAVMIVGLAITIAVVVVKRNEASVSEEEATVEPLPEELQPFADYDEIKSEITDKILENEMTGDLAAMAELYKRYADEATDETVKQLLLTDYYSTLMAMDYTLSHKDDIVGEMKKIDERLKTTDSALNVMMAGYYYSDYNLMREYRSILEERGFDVSNVDYMLEGFAGVNNGE